MEGSQLVINPAIPEADHTDAENLDAEEPNNGDNEESKNEMNEQQESGIINHVIEEEDSGETLSGNKQEEASANPDKKTSILSGARESSVSSRKPSHRSSHISQKSQQPVNCQALLSSMPLQMEPSNDVSTKGSLTWVSQRTGKEMKCKFNQTSFIWERKPLAEILRPSSKIPQISEETEKKERDVQEAIPPVGDAETQPGTMQESVHSMQPLEGEGGQVSSPPPMKQESELGQQPEEQAPQAGGQHTIVPLPPEDRKPPQVQPLHETATEGDIRWVSKKTGKEVKCSFNQTSLIWERKPLAEILCHPSAKTAEMRLASEQEGSPSPAQLNEQESQHDSPQLEVQESQQDGEQEAPAEAQQAPEEALENSDEMPKEPEKTPEALGEALETMEAAPEGVEAVLEAPEEAPEEAPAEAPEEAPAEAPAEAQEEAPEEAPAEAPEEAPAEAQEEAPEEAPDDAPDEAPAEAPEEVPAEAPES